MKPPRRPLMSRVNEIRALIDEGGVVCETRSAPGDPVPAISTLIQVDGDMVTMVGPHPLADAVVERHVADVTAFFARTERTLRSMFYGVAGLLTGSVVALTGVAAGWWQALVGLVGGVLAGAVSRLLTTVGRAATPLRWIASAVAAATTLVAAVFDRPVVAWLCGLGLVLAGMAALARWLAGVLIRGRRGRA